MKERLLEFLKVENKSSAQLAEEIGVQPSGISHILSGRNNPSLDFVLKMLEKYRFLSTEWLLFGTGSMYKDTKMQSLFDESFLTEKEKDRKEPANEKITKELEFNDDNVDEIKTDQPVTIKTNSPSVERIVWFFDDKSFVEYFPDERNQK
ncbi:MAG: helix-turn-helix domain-containing protein [Bacteroidales bacterium]|nr:helix-turn-helix domain-containing protein [Bacteroidales bacterium]